MFVRQPLVVGKSQHPCLAFLTGIRSSVTEERTATMPLAESDIKEQLSKAYVRAIAARCGFRCAIPEPDRAGDDLWIDACGPLPSGGKTGAFLFFQLKSTSKKVKPNEDFTLRLDRRTYDILRDTNRASTILLVVFLLPSATTRWLTSDHDSLVTRHCAYWLNLKGAEPIKGQSRTVKLSRKNVFSVAALNELMRRVASDEEVGDAI
jgi:hypothetical protein